MTTQIPFTLLVWHSPMHTHTFIDWCGSDYLEWGHLLIRCVNSWWWRSIRSNLGFSFLLKDTLTLKLRGLAQIRYLSITGLYHPSHSRPCVSVRVCAWSMLLGNHTKPQAAGAGLDTSQQEEALIVLLRWLLMFSSCNSGQEACLAHSLLGFFCPRGNAYNTWILYLCNW